MRVQFWELKEVSRVPIYYEMHTRSYDFLYILHRLYEYMITYSTQNTLFIVIVTVNCFSVYEQDTVVHSSLKINHIQISNNNRTILIRKFHVLRARVTKNLTCCTRRANFPKVFDNIDPAFNFSFHAKGANQPLSLWTGLFQ